MSGVLLLTSGRYVYKLYTCLGWNVGIIIGTDCYYYTTIFETYVVPACRSDGPAVAWAIGGKGGGGGGRGK